MKSNTITDKLIEAVLLVSWTTTNSHQNTTHTMIDIS